MNDFIQIFDTTAITCPKSLNKGDFSTYKITLRIYTKKVLNRLYKLKFLCNLKNENYSINELINALIFVKTNKLNLKLSKNDIKNIENLKVLYKNKGYITISSNICQWVNQLNKSNLLLHNLDNNINQIASVLNLNHKLGKSVNFSDFQQINELLTNYHSYIKRCLNINSEIQTRQAILWNKISLA